MAGAEGGAGRRQHHGAHAAVLRQTGKGVAQGFEQAEREGVAGRRPVERQGGDAVMVRAQQEGVWPVSLTGILVAPLSSTSISHIVLAHRSRAQRGARQHHP
ncbi:hypothetical protein GCM10025880_21330 [Methylorubrum aminovorans]|nr:hypothetical protein GCM10025880_21330 [Methylorubrum aminovorans]